ARNAVRMSALIPTGAIHVYTHDSIGLGEDGPTHQPVEHVASLRMIPNLDVWRPADKVETAAAWAEALKRRRDPTALVLTRQGLPHLDKTEDQIEAIAKGGYVLADAEVGGPEAILIATGSEVGLAMEAAAELKNNGTRVRVVSMPNPGRFLEQDESYRESVLPGSIKARVAIEAGVTWYWWPFVGEKGRVIGIDTFGASAPADELFREYGFTTENVVSAVREVL